jgi:hypothetical protein
MPTRFLKDDNGNDSSLRLVFLVFMIVTVTLLVIITALLIRSHLSGIGSSDTFNDLIKWLTTGSLGGFIAKVAQKYLERRSPEPQRPTDRPASTSVPPVPADTKKPQAMKLGIVIDRFSENDKRTLGHAGIWNGQRYVFNYVTLELPWKGNQRNISRIPSGTYDAVAIPRASNGDYAILLMGVVGRSEIMQHAGNFHFDIRGCILAGEKFEHLDSDGVMDVTNSRNTMQKIESYFPVGNRLKVEIRDKFT